MTATEGVNITPADASFGDEAVEVTMRISRSMLGGSSDNQLAMLWHVLQAAPAEFDNKEVGRIAEAVGREIIRRWLREVEPELYRQQGNHYPHHQLTRFAKWNGSDWELKDDVFQAEVERRAAQEEEG